MEKQAFIRACREGGVAIEAALRELDRSFHATLYRESVRLLHDGDSAVDVVQETFIKVWQRCALFKGESELLPWVRVILRNGILDRLRRPTREIPTLEDDGAMSSELAERLAELATERVPTPDDELRRRELAECFERCWVRFEQAAPAHAAVLTWIVEDGLDNQAIADLLGRTPGATREFISQCRKRARVHLAEWYALALGTETSHEPT